MPGSSSATAMRMSSLGMVIDPATRAVTSSIACQAARSSSRDPSASSVSRNEPGLASTPLAMPRLVYASTRIAIFVIPGVARV